MGRTVEELEATMSAREFGRWCVLNGIQPWGDFRLDILTGLIRSSALAPYAKEPIPVSDLIPEWGQRPLTQKQQWAKSADAFRTAMAAMKADRRRGQ